MVKCIFFFLDSHRSQRISISKLAHNSIMEDLLYLIRMSDQGNYSCSHKYSLLDSPPFTVQDDSPTVVSKPTVFNNLDDDDVLSPPIEFNWFSGANTIRLYHEFLLLDQDKNGIVLTKSFTYLVAHSTM